MNSTLKRVFASIVLAQMGFQTVSALPSFSMPESVSSNFEAATNFVASNTFGRLSPEAQATVTSYVVPVKDAVASQMTLQNGKYVAVGAVALAGLYAGYKYGKNLSIPKPTMPKFAMPAFLTKTTKVEVNPVVLKADWKTQVLNAVKANNQELALSLVKNNSELTRVIKSYFVAVNAKWDALKVSQRLNVVEVQLKLTK